MYTCIEHATATIAIVTEYGLFYTALLQKRPIDLRSLLIEATPYMYISYINVYMYRTRDSNNSNHSCMRWLRLVGSLKNIGLFYKMSSLLYGSFARKTYVFEEPTNRSHPIHVYLIRKYIHVSST